MPYFGGSCGSKPLRCISIICAVQTIAASQARAGSDICMHHGENTMLQVKQSTVQSVVSVSASPSPTALDVVSISDVSPSPSMSLEAPPVDAKTSGLYFRPVSASVLCVMGLTIECLIIYISLALSRNADELSGLAGNMSKCTEVLQMAARSVEYPPMMCVLFVGCRLYVLATTEGLGEPQWWAKAAMFIASIGMTLQFFVSLALPLMTRRQESAERGQAIKLPSEDSPGIHPLIQKHVFDTESRRRVFTCLQTLCMILIYGGVGGVVAAIALYPKGAVGVSPALQCIVLLSCLYFGVHLCLFVARTLCEEIGQLGEIKGDAAKTGQGEKLQPARQPILGAVVHMATAVRKVPMLAVFLLATRIRALQLSPPSGMPPSWTARLFFALTAAAFMEALAAAFVGATGSMSTSYYNHAVFKATPASHAVMHCCSFAVYGGVLPIYWAVLAMVDDKGVSEPLPTTQQCVFLFAGLYFGVDSLRSLAFFAQDVFQFQLPVALDALVAAGVSVGFCPTLCVLFIATQMRALQITQNEGRPQDWAQSCMFICVLATVLQALCCLMLPVFTRGVSRVDPEGNPVYDMRPMVAAYVVTVIKYVVLSLLFGAVSALCVSIALITPDTASRDHVPASDMASLLWPVAGGIIVLLFSMVLGSAKVVGLAVKFAVESVDETLLGVQITVNAAALAVCRGYVNLSGLIVHNPEAKEGQQPKPWTTDHLARVDSLVVKINMWRLIRSLGCEFEIDLVELRGVDVNFDKPSLFGRNSNVQEVLDHLDTYSSAEGGGEPAAQAEASASQAIEDTPKPRGAQASEDTRSARQVVIHEVHIRDIGAAGVLKGKALLIRVGDIEFQDFMQHLASRGGRTATIAADVADVVVRSVMQSVMANVRPALVEAQKRAWLGSCGGGRPACCLPVQGRAVSVEDGSSAH